MTETEQFALLLDAQWKSGFKPSGMHETPTLGFREAAVSSGVGQAVLRAFELWESRGNGISVGIWGEIIGHDDAASWRYLALAAQHPRSSCRLADVAWCADPSDRDIGRVASEAYLACGSLWVLDEIEGGHDLVTRTLPDGSSETPDPDHKLFLRSRVRRARQIAVAAKLDDLVTTADAMLLTEVEAALSASDPKGAHWFLTAANTSTASRPDWFVAKAQAVLAALSDDPKAVEHAKSVVAILRASPAPTGYQGNWKEDLRQAELEAVVAFAYDADGAVRYFRLQRAHNFAEQYGYIAERDQIAADLTGIDETQFLEKRRTPIPIDPVLLRNFESQVDRASNALTDAASLVAVLSTFSPPDIAHAIAAHDSAGRGINVPAQQIGIGINFQIDDDAEQRRFDIARLMQLEALISAEHLLLPVLDHAAAQQIVGWTDAWQAWHIRQPGADRLAEATRLHFEQRWEASAHLSAPTIEQALRVFAEQHNAVLRRPPRPKADYIPPGSGAILEKLTGYVDETLRQWLQNLLVDAFGFNLPNSLAHGTHGTVTAQQSALLLHAAALIHQLPPPATTEEEE